MTAPIGWTSPATLHDLCGAFTSSAHCSWHGPFKIEHVFGFYGLLGFIACVVLVLAAKQLRKVLMRPEDYYDR